MPYAASNGMQIYYEVLGEGFPLLLIHGVGMSLEQWKLDDLLSRLAQKHQVIALDCRGHGRSDKPEHYSLEELATDVLDLMDALGLDQADLMGASMGSYIAQQVAILAPERIRKLILITPKSNGLTSSIERIMAEHREEFMPLDEAAQQVFLNRFVFYRPEMQQQYADLLVSELSLRQQQAAHASMRGFDFRSELPQITAQTLVISGQHDGLNPPEEGRLCAELIPNAEFVVMASSAHIPMLEEPERFYAIVTRFLASERGCSSLGSAERL